MDLGNQVHLYIYTRLMYNVIEVIMTTFLTSLLEHPWIMFMLCTTLCVLVGQTYDFILIMFGRKPSEELNDEEKEIFNQMKEVIEKDKEDNKNKQEYIYDDNIKGVYE